MKYEPSEFITKITNKTNIKEYKCPFCGCEEFNTPESYATIPTSKEFNNVVLGPNIPAGMIVCKNCGHIDFFALGALDMIKNENKR